MIAYLLIIAVAFYVVAVTLIQLVGDYLFNLQVQDDQRMAESIATEIRDEYLSRDAEAMFSHVGEYALDGVSRVLVLDKYGVVQVDTQSSLNGRRFDNTEAANALNTGSSSSNIYQSNDYSSWAEHAMMSISGVQLITGVYASAILGDSGIVGAIVYISQAQEIFEELGLMRTRIILWLVLVALLTIVLSLFVVRMITEPIGELSVGISRMAEGDLSGRVRVRGKNEFTQLAIAFNMMCDRLEALDNSRNMFVSNASHELKTPLSTMKILIETLIYQEIPFEPPVQKEFLTDIDKEIDRLNSIISDLLTLVKIDSDGMKLRLTDIRVGTILQDQAKRLLPLARERGIELDCVVRDMCDTAGDETKLQQVFYNVIDNAIKYTSRGGSVKVELVKSGKTAVTTITDSGVGIPESDLPHIFERFYRVDKARSRETGGTGLGLSIVREIITLHDGSIYASSKVGEGSTFTIELPIIPRKELKADA